MLKGDGPQARNKKNVYYTQTIKKLTLPTQGQDSWIAKLHNMVDFLLPPYGGWKAFLREGHAVLLAIYYKCKPAGLQAIPP